MIPETGVYVRSLAITPAKPRKNANGDMRRVKLFTITSFEMEQDRAFI
jgi:hypothetical protein